MVVPLALVLSVPALVWFSNHWTVFDNDSGRYLLAASQLILGQAFEGLSSISEFNGGHGPAFPALVGTLIVVFGRDTEELVWAMRLMALLNPLLAYLLARRLSNPAGGLMAAALVALLGYDAKSTIALNIDPLLLTFYLLALLVLIAAVERKNSVLALLSGMLLGTSILTKETALANAPLALLAVLLLDWELRGALWHYLGVVLMCLPWWVWAWSATGDIYLIDRLPIPLQIPVLVAGAIFLVLGAVAYASGLIGRFLADERRRRWSGWFVVIAWSVALSGLVLATATHALGRATIEAVRVYLTRGVLSPATVVVPTLCAVVVYVCWKALGRDAPVAWRLLALAMLFQVPVCLLVVVEHWLPRQFLVLQTLVLCALGALVANAGEAALESGRDFLRRFIGALVAVVLACVVLVACVGSAQELLPEDPVSSLSMQDRVPPQEARMVDWMAENIPKGEHILIAAEPLINKEQAYMMFLDGGRHEWTKLRLDQGLCEPRPNVQMRCDPAKNDISGIPHDAIWVQEMTSKMGECKFMSLSMSNLLEQVRREDADYVMIAGPYQPRYANLPAPLLASKAFEVAHTEFPQEGDPAGTQGVVLLKRTDLAPKELPTYMYVTTLRTLKACQQARDPGSAEGLDSKFPNGILVFK
ncbi:MAG: glycosyltransferase family 39 protein [Actinomycetota bacterium]|nr:glycosyltransferase family 39 protein [Actinomycetota bacterium]